MPLESMLEFPVSLFPALSFSSTLSLLPDADVDLAPFEVAGSEVTVALSEIELELAIATLCVKGGGRSYKTGSAGSLTLRLIEVRA